LYPQAIAAQVMAGSAQAAGAVRDWIVQRRAFSAAGDSASPVRRAAEPAGSPAM